MTLAGHMAGLVWDPKHPGLSQAVPVGQPTKLAFDQLYEPVGHECPKLCLRVAVIFHAHQAGTDEVRPDAPPAQPSVLEGADRPLKVRRREG